MVDFSFDFASLPQVSIPAWFTVDTRLGSLSVHLDTPQCFSAEMYSADLNIVGKPEDDKVRTHSFLCSLVHLHNKSNMYTEIKEINGDELITMVNRLNVLFMVDMDGHLICLWCKFFAPTDC